MDEERLLKTRTILRNLHTVMEELEMVAKDDGTVTEEERSLLDLVEDQINRYHQLVDEVLADDVVTREEASKMRSFELEIIRSTIRLAQHDWKVTDDEQIVLARLQDVLLELDKLD